MTGRLAVIGHMFLRPISPAPSGSELCSGIGAAAGERLDQESVRSAAPEGQMNLAPGEVSPTEQRRSSSMQDDGRLRRCADMTP